MKLKNVKYIWVIGFIVVVFALFQYFYPGNPNGINSDNFEIVAHRGAHVMWKQGEYDLTTGCEATHIYKPTEEQTYIENTIESIKRAFELGATIVEIDIRPSKDNVLMISHEENLECKTDGHGKIYDYTAEELKNLDVGYGFTYDNGETYPFRGKGLGKMPTLKEVLEEFPDKKFLIDHKDRTKETADLLIEELKNLKEKQRKNIYYWGSKEIGDYIQSEIFEVKRLLANRSEMKSCLLKYILSFGIFGFGDECNGLAVGMTKEYSKYMWGWPYNFIKKAHKNNSPVYLMVDTLEEIEWAKSLPIDGIITDHIEIITDNSQYDLNNNFGNDQIEKAVSDYLLTEKRFSWRNRDDSHTFCVVENLKPEKELFPLYVWAYCGEYIVQNGELKTISGSSGPAKINYPNVLSYYDLSRFSYEAPGDGADYTKDVKKIFPEDVQQKIFNHDTRDLIARAENYAFANISNWNLIKEAIANCEIKSIMQTHSLDVTATFEDNKTITAQEPEIDDIFDVVSQYKDKCGEIIMATE
jgi:glycerophosphoryl diester phosphodiesterase